MRRLLLVCTALALASCNGGSGAAGPGPDSGAPEPTPADGPDGSCVRPAEGCPCEPGTEPIECYAEPERGEDGELLCKVGTRSCRDGRWTACESLRPFTLGRAAGLVTDPPTICNACDPACYEAEDTPNDADLTTDNSSDVVYDTTRGGIGLVPEEITTAGDDADGDGVPDVADDYPGDPSRDGVTEEGGLFHILPYGGPAEIDSLDLMAQVTTADVYFLMDATGSMGDEIANLKSDLTSGTITPGCPGGIIGAIECTIPDAWTGVGMFEDYPSRPYGSLAGCNADSSFCWDDDTPYRNLSNLGDDPSATQTGVNAIDLGFGGDGPESQSHALWATVTGNDLNGFTPAAGGCGAEQWGYPCFRETAIPIIVLFTDASFHNGPTVRYDYDGNMLDTGGLQSLPPPTDQTGVKYFGFGDVSGRWVSATGDTSVLSDWYGGWPCGNGSAGDVAFRFRMSAPGRVTISAQGTSFDTVLGLFPMDCATGDIGAGICTNDSFALGPQSRLRDFSLDAGCYLGILDGEGAADGPYQLTVGEPCAAGYCEPVSPSWSETLTALADRNVRVITVESSGGSGDTQATVTALANATGAVDGGGSPYAFSISTDGTGLSDAVVTAIEQLANSTRFDISARPTDDPATGAVDERGFVQSITVTGWGPGSCAGSSGNTAFDCSPGTVVDFNVELRNDFVMPQPTPQVFDFYIEVLLDDVVQERIPVRIVVPAEVTTYPSGGTYTRTWNAGEEDASGASLTCEIPPQRPDWGIFEWDASTPSDSGIRFEFRTAPTEAELATATPVSITVPPRPDAGSVDVGALLSGAGLSAVEPFLRMTAVLAPSADRTAAPLLTSYRIQYDCFAAE